MMSTDILERELDPSRPVMMTAFPDAECKVLGVVRSNFFPIIVAVAFPGMAFDVVYHVSQDDGTAISGFERVTYSFANRE